MVDPPPTDTPPAEIVSAETRSFLGRRHGIWIDGQECFDYGGGELDVIDPASERTIARVGLANERDIDRAVSAAARALQGPWPGMTADERARILLAFAERVERNAILITEVGILDSGMPRAVSESAAPVSALLLRYYAGWTTKIAGQTLPSGALGRRPKDLLAFTLREPIGVVGAITPWNYPFGMEMLKIAPALAAGCTLVLKVAEQAPLAGLVLAEIAQDAGVPPGVLNVVPGLGTSAGAALASHPRVDKIAFTGSTDVGRTIVRAAAGNLKKVSLELGGKSPVIVFPDADLDAAVPGAAMAAFGQQGQNCACGSRLFVHRSIADEFSSRLVEFTRGLRVGSPLARETFIGPLISGAQRQRVESYLAAAARDGAVLRTGGERVGERGYFIAPTVYDHCAPNMQIVREEIFGPVVAIQTFDTTDVDAVADAANATAYGLTGSVWTHNLSLAMRMVKLIDAGVIGVNCHAAVDPSMPFGGNKESGWGREFGAEALNEYLKTKAVTVTW